MRTHCSHYWYIALGTAWTNKEEIITVISFTRIGRRFPHAGVRSSLSRVAAIPSKMELSHLLYSTWYPDRCVTVRLLISHAIYYGFKLQFLDIKLTHILHYFKTTLRRVYTISAKTRGGGKAETLKIDHVHFFSKQVKIDYSYARKNDRVLQHQLCRDSPLRRVVFL